MTINSIESNPWQKATIIGSVWGAFEVVAGSILHNLAIPMVAGTILSVLGVIIMVTGARIFGGKGIFWRSALICAALKTVSPSPVILTPMLGITIEGVLMETGVILLGSNIAGYLLGGGLAVLSVLLFKLARIVMIYGTDIIAAYKSIFNQYFENDSISSNGHIVLVWVIITVFFIFGLVAAAIGYFGGNEIKRRYKNLDFRLLPSKNRYKPSVVNGYKGGIGFLIFHIVWIIVYIFVKDFINPIYWQTGGIVYIILCFYRYGRIRKMLKKPGFWLVIVLVSLISGIFILKSDFGKFIFNIELIKYSFSISVRAAVVIIGFACINIELMSKGVSQHFKGSFFSPLANSFSNAHDALPSLITSIKFNRHTIFRPMPVIEKMFSHFTTNISSKSKPRIYIVTADKHGGKTSFLTEMLVFFEKEQIPVSGFIAEGEWDENGQRSGFNLIILPDKSKLKLCDKVTTSWSKHGSYFFNPIAIERGNEQLNKILPGRIVFIDEIGFFELEGFLWANAFEKLISENSNILVISIRKSFLQQAIDKWNLEDAILIDATTDCPDEIVSDMLD